MFIYEKRDIIANKPVQTLNLTFTGQLPVDAPEFVIKENITTDEHGKEKHTAILCVNNADVLIQSGISNMEFLDALPVKDIDEHTLYMIKTGKPSPYSYCSYIYHDNEWVALSYPSSAQTSCIFNAQTHYDFPSVGKADIIYKAEKEQQIYQWNSTKLIYEPLNVSSGSVLDIELINGGNSNG